MRLLFAILTLVLGLNLNAQDEDTFVVSKSEIKSFFIEIIPTINNRPTTILINKTLTVQFDKLANRIPSVDSFFSTADIDFINSQVNQTKHAVWDESLIYNATIVSKESMDSSFKPRDLSKNWRAVYKKYGGGYYQFSIPYFSQYKNTCALLIDYHCGPLCGQGSIKIFRKTESGWRLIKTILRWVS